MAERDRFLAEVGAALPFDDVERDGILEELATHLADSAADLEAGGLPADDAERAAIARLGPPARLADELTRARRTPRRLLAAAGAGTWAAVTGVIYGYLFGLLVLLTASFGVALVVGLAARLVGVLPPGLSVASNSTITLLALGIGAYAAGLKVTPAVAARAGYRRRVARRVTTVVGGSIIFIWALVGWRGVLDWPTVVVLLSLPAWYVVGAWTASGARFPTRRWRLGAVGLGIVVVTMSIPVGGGPSGQVSVGVGAWPGSPESGFGRIGAPAPEAVAAAQDLGSGGSLMGGVMWVATVFRDPAVLAGWRDLRVEAWRGIDHDRVDPTAARPFAVGPAALGPAGESPFGSWPGGSWYGGEPLPPTARQLSGSVRIDRTPGVTWTFVAITGRAPDGTRHILHGPSLEQTAFDGTALDWLAAVIRDGR